MAFVFVSQLSTLYWAVTVEIVDLLWMPGWKALLEDLGEAVC